MTRRCMFPVKLSCRLGIDGNRQRCMQEMSKVQDPPRGSRVWTGLADTLTGTVHPNVLTGRAQPGPVPELVRRGYGRNALRCEVSCRKTVVLFAGHVCRHVVPATHGPSRTSTPVGRRAVRDTTVAARRVVHTAGFAAEPERRLPAVKSDENPACFARLHCLCSHLCERLRTSRYARSRGCRGQESILGVHCWKARQSTEVTSQGADFHPGLAAGTSVLLARPSSTCLPGQPASDVPTTALLALSRSAAAIWITSELTGTAGQLWYQARSLVNYVGIRVGRHTVAALA